MRLILFILLSLAAAGLPPATASGNNVKEEKEEKEEDSNKPTKAEITACKQELLVNYKQCMSQVQEQHEQCMMKAKIIFNRIERISDISQCRKNSQNETANCKSIYKKCYTFEE